MSKLEKLIAELCPNGVEFVKLGEHVKILRGKRLTTRDIVRNAQYPVYHGGIVPIGKYDKKNRNANTTMIINVGASAGTIGYSDVDFWSSDGCFCLEKTNLYDDRFLFHLMLTYERYLKSKVRKAGIPTLDNRVIENLVLPVPPLEVQREIVRVLDSFTLLTTELIAKLTAEHTVRKKQYDFYRDILLKRNDKVSVKTIDELCNVSAGGDAPREAMSKEKTIKYCIPIISNGVGENALYGYTNEAKITEPAVTVAARGTIGYAEYRDYPYVPIIRLMIQPNIFTKWIFEDQGQEINISKNFQHYTNEKLTPRLNNDFTEVTFSYERGNDEKLDNIKISKGEESCFVWSIFYSLLRQITEVLNIDKDSIEQERETDAFDNLEYVFIDDPVTSLDENHLIEFAVDLAEIIKKSKSDLKFIITTHNPLFYNVLSNEFSNNTVSWYNYRRD